MCVSECVCECARAHSSCARVHVRVCASSHMCVVCSTALHSAGLHRAVQVLVRGLCTRRVRRACIARVMRARGASARVRGLAFPGAGNRLRGLESAQVLSSLSDEGLL